MCQNHAYVVKLQKKSNIYATVILLLVKVCGNMSHIPT